MHHMAGAIVNRWACIACACDGVLASNRFLRFAPLVFVGIAMSEPQGYQLLHLIVFNSQRLRKTCGFFERLILYIHRNGISAHKARPARLKRMAPFHVYIHNMVAVSMIHGSIYQFLFDLLLPRLLRRYHAPYAVAAVNNTTRPRSSPSRSSGIGSPRWMRPASATIQSRARLVMR